MVERPARIGPVALSDGVSGAPARAPVGYRDDRHFR
jgi:hypothetical protein